VPLYFTNLILIPFAFDHPNEPFPLALHIPKPNLFPMVVNIFEGIQMYSIVIAIETRGKATTTCIMDVIAPHYEIVSQLALGEQVFVEGVEGAISRKRMHCGMCKRRRGSNILMQSQSRANAEPIWPTLYKHVREAL
jgi:hypothetical protein